MDAAFRKAASAANLAELYFEPSTAHAIHSRFEEVCRVRDEDSKNLAAFAERLDEVRLAFRGE